MPGFSNFTEGLANLSLKTVLVIVGIMMLTLTALRLPSRGKDHTTDWLVENVQVVLSVVVVVFLIIRPFLFQAFYIPSDSMVPTLMGPSGNGTTGDRLLVNKLIYRVADPQRRDIAVFWPPDSAFSDPRAKKEYIKRVIGLPNETVEVVPPRLVVDGRAAVQLLDRNVDDNTPGVRMSATAPPVQLGDNAATLELDAQQRPLKVIVRPDLQMKSSPYRVEVAGKVLLKSNAGEIEASPDLKRFGAGKGVTGRVFSLEGEPRLIVVKGKKLAHDPGHVIVNGERLPESYITEAPEYAYGPKKLGADQYFMMGDNRNNSEDSHRWGPLERDRFIGRAEILFWPLQRFRILHWWLVAVIAAILVGYQIILRLRYPGGGHSAGDHH
jgi:signal peptidase I